MRIMKIATILLALICASLSSALAQEKYPNSLAPAVQPLIEQAEVIRHIGATRGKPHRLLVGGDGGAIVPAFGLRQRQVVPRISPIRRAGSRVAERGRRRWEVRLLQVCDAERVVGVGALGIEPNRASSRSRASP